MSHVSVYKKGGGTLTDIQTMKMQYRLTLDDIGDPEDLRARRARAVAALLECGFRVIEVECRWWRNPRRKRPRFVWSTECLSVGTDR